MAYPRIANFQAGFRLIDGTALNKLVAALNDLLRNGTPQPITGTTGVFSGAVTALSLLVTSLLGYATGAGGAVTQATDKSTAVTLNKICGAITMNGAAL